jgi:hypothetical protein
MENVYRKRIREALSGNSFLTVNKTLLLKFGPKKAIFIANLIDKLIYSEQRGENFSGWFLQPHKNQQRETGIKECEIRKCKKYFIELGILKTKMAGMPAREWYFVDLDRYIKVIDDFDKGRTK